MFIDVSAIQSKKIPRILLPSIAGSREPLKNISVMWPDRSRSDVYDLSLAGILVSAQGQVSLRKIKQQLELRLELGSYEHSLILKCRIETMSGEAIGLSFDSLSASHRLVIEQNVKDRILIQNLRVLKETPLGLEGALWIHGPFDTNIFLWQQNPGYSLEKAIIEYDNLQWFYDEGAGVRVLKSGSATDPAKAYLSFPRANEQGARTLIGAGWADRFVRCLEVLIQGNYLPENSESLRVLQNIVKEKSV